MTAFTIDAENNITVFASLKEIQGSEEGTQTFTNQEELAALAAKAGWPAGGNLEQLAGGTTRRAVHQPAGRSCANLEGHTTPEAQWWRTQAAGGIEEG